MNTTTYADFLNSKRVVYRANGISGTPDLHPSLFLFQRDIVQFALRKGRAAIFTATGTGKTLMQSEWARVVAEHTNGDVLILAPLAVAQQTVREAQEKVGVKINHCRTSSDIEPGINITNYERLHYFTDHKWAGLVLDESSILKSFGGVMRKEITEFGADIDYRLACTATPAPNDLVEITNHAEFLDVMSGKEIIALFFKQDGNTTHSWRLRRHAVKDFYQWLSSWAVALRRPSDLGYSDEGFIRPPVQWHHVQVELLTEPTDTLFHVEALSLQERLAARRGSLTERVQSTASMVNSSTDTWVVWCNLNTESQALCKAIPDAVEITGSESPEAKELKLVAFSEGRIRVLVTKPSIAGYGLNWQLCHNTAYVGLSDSFEDLHQSISRFDRYGQTEQVNAWVITSPTEGAVVANIERKRRQFNEMMDALIQQTNGMQLEVTARQEAAYVTDHAEGIDWEMYLGDSIEVIDQLENDSAGLILYSPPFPGMYAYSNSTHDIGNTTHIDQMIDHYRFLVGKDKLLRVCKPGRLHCVHLMQLTAMMTRDGYIGIKDYRGRVIQMMEEEGWIYTGEVTIDKNPQIQATRNKERGLLFKSLATDAAMMRMGLADYLIYFRKPGANEDPIKAGISQKYNAGAGWITEEEWIEWAAPVWYRQTKHYPGGIRETDVLNVAAARESEDERHLCPLQLGVIERAVKLWSKPGDVVLSPFAGIGSEGYVSIRNGRKFVGIELKRSYFNTACHNLTSAETQNSQLELIA